MPVTTVPVTVRLADFGGGSDAGILITARMSDVDFTPDGTFVSNEPVTATTDAEGIAVLNLFPNAVSPGGLGTKGTIVRVKATLPNSRKLNVLAVIPNEPVSLTACVVSQEITGLDASQMAAADAQAARNLAKRWATQTTAEVEAGQGYGAQKYANDAAASEAAVAHVYPGTFAVAPLTRPNGSAIQAGDRYVNSTDGYEYTYRAGVWNSDEKNAAASASAASGSASAAAASQASAASSAGTATSQASIASAASATAGAYPNGAASNVPRGLTQASVGAITPGAGGANGTFALGFSAGTGWVTYPSGTFTVAGGAVTAVTITGPGLCLHAAPVVPTVSFAASAGLAGAAVALTIQFLVTAGQGYWVASADGNTLDRYKNVAGAATSDVANVPSIPANGIVTALALASGVKKYQSLVPLDALYETAFLNSGSINQATHTVSSSDVIFKALGAKAYLTAAFFHSTMVRPSDTITTLDSKWVTIGYVANSPTSNWHANALSAVTATDKTGVTGAVTTAPAAGNRRTLDIDATHRLYYTQVQMPAGSSGKYLFLDETTVLSTFADTIITAPFIFVTDAQPALSDLDIFPGLHGKQAQDYATASAPNQLIDQIGQSLVANHSTSFVINASIATLTDKEVTDVLPSGSAIALADSGQALFIMPSVAGAQNKYGIGSVYAYSPTGDFTGFSLTWFLRNGTTSVAITALQDTVRIVEISANLRRYDLVGSFTLAWASYGIAARGLRTAGQGPANIYIFGFMGAISNTPRYGEYLQPTAWVPPNEMARGYQVVRIAASNTNPWTGKKIVWMGTSIPVTGQYPQSIGSELGVASMQNIAVSGGSIRAFAEDGSWFSQSTLIFKFALEIGDVNARYGANIGFEVDPADYLTRQPGSGKILAQADLDALVSANWVAKLQPHIATGDLFVFDYGINDRVGQTTYPFQDSASVLYDRKHFAGAVAYIYKKIYDARKALGLPTRAVMITHHSRYASTTLSSTASATVDAQIAIAKYWGMHCINLADSCGVNSLTLTDLSDGLHFQPNSTLDLRVRKQIVEALKAVNP